MAEGPLISRIKRVTGELPDHEYDEGKNSVTGAENSADITERLLIEQEEQDRKTVVSE